MNGFNLSDIQDAKLGGTQLSAIYLGSSKLWPTAFDYSKEYFTIESLDDNNTISIKNTFASGTPSSVIRFNWYYSIDKTNWTALTVTRTSGTTSAITVNITTLNNGDKIYLKGSAYTCTLAYNTNNFQVRCYNSFDATGQFNISGNIMSLKHGDNFVNENTLTSASSFYYAFNSSTNLVNASNLVLPATTLTEYCYYGMFRGCTSLASLPAALPATALSTGCYNMMFYQCTSLTTIPNGFLPATTLADSCYYSMFDRCSGITTVPTNLLPATTLANNCYRSMFYKNSSMTTPLNLPATTLANSCYYSMFQGCTSLTTPPTMSATTVAISCCESMFRDDAALTTAPDLLATTLANRCYYYMFRNCTSLQYIKCLATNIPSSACTDHMTSNVAATGTFVKDANMTSWTTGQNGIPSGWTVVNV